MAERLHAPNPKKSFRKKRVYITSKNQEDRLQYYGFQGGALGKELVSKRKK